MRACFCVRARVRCASVVCVCLSVRVGGWVGVSKNLLVCVHIGVCVHVCECVHMYPN